MNNWIRQHSYSDMHRDFLYKISNLRDLVEMQVATDHEDTYYKMSFAHAVTLMESFLSDSVRSLVLSNKTYLVNAITNIDELKNLKFSLAEIIKFTDGISSIVTSELGQLMYHNIPKIRQVLGAILGKKLSLDISKVCEITTYRHDIVHRDGKTLDGKFIEIDKQFALDTIMHIEIFIQQVASEISEITTAKYV